MRAKARLRAAKRIFFHSSVTGILMAGGLSSWIVAQAPQAFAQTAARIDFSVPGGSLADALTVFGRQAGVQVTYLSAVSSGKTTRGFSGSATKQQALAQLLAGSGLSYTFTNSSTVAISAPAGRAGVATGAAVPGATQLDVIDVIGSGETGNGPVQGIVAHQTVTGTKTDTPLLETPQSVSVISKDQIQLTQATSLGETLRYTPGVLAEEFGGLDTRIDQYMIRGFTNSMPFVDGLSTISRFTLLSSSVEPYGVERIAVLRGPASVLYGQNVPGGIVDVVSKRPQETPSQEIQLQGGSYGWFKGAFDITGPVTPDKSVLYRLVFAAHDGGTQIDNVNTRRYYVAPSLTFAPSSDTSITFLSHAQLSNDGFEFQNLPAQGTLYYNSVLGKIPTSLFTGEPGFNSVTREEYAIGYSAEHHLNNVVTLRQNLRYTNMNTGINYIYSSGLVAGTSTINRVSLGAKAFQENLALDTQSQFKFDTFALNHTALLGVDYSYAHDNWVERDGTAAPLNLLAPVYTGVFTQPAPDYAVTDVLSQTGLYAQDQIRWDKFTFTGGVRQDWADTSSANLLSRVQTSLHDQAFTGRGGVTYRFDSGIAPYFSYATSFQPTLGTDFSGTPLKPTTGEQFEGGIKYEPVGYNALIMLSGYNITQNNVRTVDAAHPLFAVQTGQIQVSGFEASAVGDLQDGWKVIGSYTYMHGEITKANGGVVGNRPIDVPNDMANLLIDKTFIGGPIDGFGLNGGVRFVGQRYGDQANTLSIPSNVLFDAGLHYEYKGWRASVTAKNVFDKVYIGTCSSVNYCYYGQRRTILGTLSYKW